MLDLSSEKFNRQFMLKVGVSTTEEIIISSPFTCDFTVSRNNLASMNTATFTLYNLNRQTRAQIYKDIYDQAKKMPVSFFAGYDYNETGMIPRVFRGDVKRAYSQRQGSDYKTVIEAFDGMIARTNENIVWSFPKGMSKKEMLYKIMDTSKQLDSITIGNSFWDFMKRGYPGIGDFLEFSNKLSDNKVYIDSNNGYALDKTEVLNGDIKMISSDSGLLGTPKKMETFVEIEMLFEPRLKPSQLIQLLSTVEPRFNGNYKITGINHRGTISGSICGDARTQVSMVQTDIPVVVIDLATSQEQKIK